MKSFNEEEDDSTCSSNSDTLSSNSLSIDFSPENNTETEAVDLDSSPQESELRGTEEEAKEECTQAKPEPVYFAPSAEQPCCSTFAQGFFPFIPILIFMGNQGPSKNNDDESSSDSDDSERESKRRPKKRRGRKPSKPKANLKTTMKKKKPPPASFRKTSEASERAPKPPPPVVENAVRSSNRIRGVPPPDFFPALRHGIPPEVGRLARSPGGHLANQRQQNISEEPARIFHRHRAFLPDGKGDKNWSYLMQFVRENYIPLYPGEFSNTTTRELESIAVQNGVERAAKQDGRSGNGSGEDSGFEGWGHQLNANNNEEGSDDSSRQRQAQSSEINGPTSEIQMTLEANLDILGAVAGDCGYNDVSSSHVIPEENNNFMTQEFARYYTFTSDGRFVQTADQDAASGPFPGLETEGRYEQYQQYQEPPRSSWSEFSSIQTSSTYTMNGGTVNTLSPHANGGSMNMNMNGMMYPQAPPPPYYPYQNLQPDFNLQYQPPQLQQPWNHPSSFFPFNEPLPLRNHGQFGPGLGDFLGLPPPPPYPGHSTWPPQVVQNYYPQSNSVSSAVSAQGSSTVPCICFDCTRRSHNAQAYEMDFEPFQPEPNQREPEGSPLQPEEIPHQAPEIPNLAQGSPYQAQESPYQAQESPRQAQGNPRQAQGNPRQAQGSPHQAQESPRLALETPRQAQETPRLLEDLLRQTQETPRQPEETPCQPEAMRSQAKQPSEYFYAVPNSSSEDEFEAESDYEGPPSPSD